jgi:hypothetical protein
METFRGENLSLDREGALYSSRRFTISQSP